MQELEGISHGAPCFVDFLGLCLVVAKMIREINRIWIRKVELPGFALEGQYNKAWGFSLRLAEWCAVHTLRRALIQKELNLPTKLSHFHRHIAVFYINTAGDT